LLVRVVLKAIIFRGIY